MSMFIYVQHVWWTAYFKFMVRSKKSISKWVPKHFKEAKKAFQKEASGFGYGIQNALPSVLLVLFYFLYSKLLCC
jgi:hypothetical protein